MENRATWELKNMIKALSIMEILNTSKENERLRQAKEELKRRKGRKWQYLNMRFYVENIL